MKPIIKSWIEPDSEPCITDYIADTAGFLAFGILIVILYLVLEVLASSPV